MKQKNQKRAFRGASLVAAVCLGVAVGFGGIGTVSAIDLDKQVVYDLGGVKVNQNEVKSNTEVSANGDPVYAGGQVSQVNQIGMMGKQDYMGTPFNVTGYTAKLIENQQSGPVQNAERNAKALFHTGRKSSEPLPGRVFQADHLNYFENTFAGQRLIQRTEPV